MRIKVDAITLVLQVDDNGNGSDRRVATNALRDNNLVTVLMGISSVDGVTPVQIVPILAMANF